ncbi:MULTISPECIES: PP2C family protein-serine/threonine phosphatase [Prevotella]|jgi:PPM family protein phosphatase|uniref:PP2C family protein-serine/threonine phosphatase n=1 Tax=Prevotella merdae TaxID=2079531 RepID=UPI000D0F4A69|nr:MULTISPECIES: protein phosphatase 2C domain-containing protein [Prevotella]MEE0669428.1 protein phosphatase 2C domain-containing protein [Prevotella sp.]
MTENNINPTAGLEEIRTIASCNICEAVGRTGIGGRKENQDSYNGVRIGETVVLTVCDGMGGMNGGQTASRIAVAEIVQTMNETPEEEISADTVRLAVENANAAIYRRAMNEPQLRGMGTTATVVVLSPKAAYITHIGDSRIYLLHKGKKEFRTFDHSKVFEMVEQGMISEEQARQSSFSNIITRALGIRPQVEMTVEILPYRKGDRFILCCDGIWNAKPEPEMIKLFNECKTAIDEVKVLTETINAYGMEIGGEHDNLTAIVADIKCNSKMQHSCFKLVGRALGRQWQRIKGTCKKKK